MRWAFDPRQGLIVVRAEVFGPAGSAVVSLALDTGATGTMVNHSRLMQLGYDPSAVPERVQIATGSGIEFAPRLVVSRFASLGRVRTAFPVLCHTLPPATGVDGLLGLDFLRGHQLLIDFRAGSIALDDGP